MYGLIAIDIDGTLTDDAGRVSDANLHAIQRARDAGAVVTLCTGRGLVECMFAVEAIAQTDPVVVAGGAIISCPVTKDTLHRFAMDPALVARVTGMLLEHDQPALVLKDPVAAGYDYLVVQGEGELPLDPVTVWWFEELGVSARFARSLDDDQHPEHTVRVGVCARSSVSTPIMADLKRELGDSSTIHHFPAVVDINFDHNQSVDIVEVFDGRAHKWSAVAELADRLGVAHGSVAAIGNDINDLTMLRGAGLGIAVANSVVEAKDAADRLTESNTNSGVAVAIDRILSGEW